jgi:ribosome-binding ATPase
MKLALCGMPRSGKSTIFAALTSRRVSAGREESNQALLTVPDERVDKLSALYQPEKTIYAQINYIDPAPPVAKPDDPTTRLPVELRQADGLVEVVRNFDAGLGAPRPREDHKSFLEEMLLNDLITVERRLEKIAKDRQRGKGGDPEENALVEEAHAMLSAEQPLRSKPELAGHVKLRGFGLLTAKPVIVVANNDDEDPEPPDMGEDVTPLVIRARIEAELAELPPDEREEFMADLGIEGSTLDRLLAASYSVLDLISFFTVGKDEVRAWTISRGSPAVEAAGAIHSDLQKGFIRAEIMRWDELLEHGSEAALKKAGLMKVVGRDHIVEDGDIAHIRFNV